LGSFPLRKRRKREMPEKFDWVETAIYVSGKFDKLTDEECQKIEDDMYKNSTYGQDDESAIYGRVLCDEGKQVPPDGYAGLAVLSYFSGQHFLAFDILLHGHKGVQSPYSKNHIVKNVFNSTNPGLFRVDGWLSPYPCIMSAISTAAQRRPSKTERFLTCLQYLFSFPKSENVRSEFKKWLSAQVLYYHYPEIRWCIKKYIARLAKTWDRPERMLSRYYNDPVHPVVLSWKGKGWIFVDKEV
jgi:hypothetical protein